MLYESQGIEAIQYRFSRVIYMIKQANILTQGEAVGCLVAHLRGDEWAGHTVNMAGGVSKCINRAMRMRKIIHGYPRKARVVLLNQGE